MTIINFLGFDLPLEWIIGVLAAFGVMAGYIYKLTSRKTLVKTYVGEFQPSGNTVIVKLKPDQVTPTHLKYAVRGTERFISHHHPFFIPNLRTKQHENLYLVPDGGQEAINPEKWHKDMMQTKSPGRMMQEHAGLVGHIRSAISGEFSPRKHLFILVVILLLGLLVGIVVDEGYLYKAFFHA